MKKIIICVLCMLLLCGCDITGNDNADTQSAVDVTVIAPKDDTVNGYRKPVSDDTGVANYIANSNSKKFHTLDCPYGIKTKPENRHEYSSRERLINEGYEPCKSCNP